MNRRQLIAAAPAAALLPTARATATAQGPVERLLAEHYRRRDIIQTSDFSDDELDEWVEWHNEVTNQAVEITPATPREWAALFVLLVDDVCIECHSYHGHAVLEKAQAQLG